MPDPQHWSFGYHNKTIYLQPNPSPFPPMSEHKLICLKMLHASGEELLAPAKVGRVENMDGLQRDIGVGGLQSNAPHLVHAAARLRLPVRHPHQRPQLRQQVQPRHRHGLGLQLRQLGRVHVADGGEPEGMVVLAVGLHEQPVEEIVGGGGVRGQAFPQHRHLALAQPKNHIE
jgi:hypothetical protein